MCLILPRFELGSQESESCVLTNYTIRSSGIKGKNPNPNLSHQQMSALNPWQWSGIFLLALTAALSIAFLFTQHRAIPLSGHEARAGLKHKTIHTVIDVRDSREWNQGHYPDAHHVPLKEIPRQLPHIVHDRSIAILFYCKSGRRAEEAAKTALDLGYTHVYYLVGDYTELTPRHNILNV